MQTKTIQCLRLSILAIALGLMAPVSQAQINLNKVKDKAKEVGNKKDKTKDTVDNNKDKVESSSSGESGAELAAKGDVEYANKNYKAALSYYEQAEKNGYTDGEMTMKMKECQKYANDPMIGTPQQKKQEALLEEANALLEAGKTNDVMAKLQQAYDACPKCADSREIEQLLGTKNTMDQMDAMKYSKPLVKDEGVTSNIHQTYMKQIVFSKTNISKSGASASQFTNSFNLGDDIIGRVYMEKSEVNEKNMTVADRSFLGSFSLRITIDGSTQYYVAMQHKNSKAELIREVEYGNYDGDYDTEKAGSEATTFRFGISEKQDVFVKNLPYQFIYEYFWNLPAGNHKVKMEYVYDIPDDQIDPKNDLNNFLYTTKFGPEKILASGEFNLNVTEAGKITAAKKICPKIDWLNNKLIKVPDGFTMISREKKANETILKVVELDADWTYKKNAFGVILSRSIAGAALVQDNNTKLYHTESVEFSQENISSGGSKYGKTMYTRSSFKNFCKECIDK